MQAERWKNARARLVRQSKCAATNALYKGVNADITVARGSGEDNNDGSKGQKKLSTWISHLQVNPLQ